MSLSSVLERVTTLRVKAEQKTINSYRELALALAQDEDVDPARIFAALLDSARTEAELERDVQELKGRQADVEAIKPLPSLREKRDALAKSQVSLREALRLAEVEYREKNADTQRELNRIDNTIRDCEAALLRLKLGRPDAREADLRKERGELLQQQGQLLNELGGPGQGLIGSLESRRKALKAGPQPHVGEFPGPLAPSIIPGLPFEPIKLQAEIDLAELAVRDRESRLKKLDGRLAEVANTLAEIERNQLTP